MMIPKPPQALDPFLAFPPLLRDYGFAVSPEQTESFVVAVGLLGPRTMDDIRWAAIATLAPPPERMAEFDALFRRIFYGQSLAPDIEGIEQEDDGVDVFDDSDGMVPPPEPDDEQDSGGDATDIERLNLRAFQSADEDERFRRFRRALPSALPQRRSRRRKRAKTGDRLDMQQVLRDAAKRDGEVVTLPAKARRMRQRRILLLLDVSGSMKDQTDTHLKLAHSLVTSADYCEVFTLGTRLTRVTRALRLSNQEQALGRVSNLVADWDGGTRLGDALQAFLSVPRFSGFARSALTLVVSDGLERGDPRALVSALEHLSRLSWRTIWLTPLMTDPDFTPQTAALQSALPFIDRIGSAASMDAICNEILSARAA